MPKISVIVIIYQVERFLEECLLSIVNQTYQNLEIILVACKGDDGCEKICEEYAQRDSRIILIKDEPRGTAIARNVGLDRATGEYIAFVDGDDYIASDMIETMYNALVNTSADISVVGKYYTYENILEGTEEKDNKEMVLDRRSSYEMILLENGFFLHIWDKLYKRELFDGLRFSPGKKVEDRQMVQILLSRADRVVYNTASRYYFRVSTDSGSKVEDNLKLSLEADRIIVGDMLREYPDLDASAEFFLVYETISVIQSSMLYGTYSRIHDKDNLRFVRNHVWGIMKNNKVPRNIKVKTLLCVICPCLLKKITINRREEFLATHKEYSTGVDWNRTFSRQKIK